MSLRASKRDDNWGLGAILCAGFALLGCSASDKSTDNDARGGAGTTTGGNDSGGANAGGEHSTSNGGQPNGTTSTTPLVIGNFSVVLNPAIDTTGPYTSVFGTVYSGWYPTDVIETAVLQDEHCAVYAFSRQSCTSPACSTSQACIATNVCADNPSLVSVGVATLAGVGDTDLKLSAINNNYQYAGDIVYPGFTEGGTVALSATGDYYSAFTVSSLGVAPLELSESDYQLSSGAPLELKWTAGSAAIESSVSILLNISKHGGSAGYLKCTLTDTGSFTVSADLVKALIDLGVAGFPQLTLKRSTSGTAAVSGGVVALEIAALANPTLGVEGYCSCFDGSDCGSCSDTTKTACDSVKKLCYAP